MPEGPLTALCVYRSPNDLITLPALKTLIGDHRAHPQNIIIGGDFNLPELQWHNRDVRLSDVNIDHQCISFLLQDCGLTQIVDAPTRGENCLDLLFTNLPTTNVAVDPGISDHMIIHCEFRLQTPITQQVPRVVHLIHAANLPNIERDMATLWANIDEHSGEWSINTLWETFTEGFHKTWQSNVPQWQCRPRPDKPWINHSY